MLTVGGREDGGANDVESVQCSPQSLHTRKKCVRIRRRFAGLPLACGGALIPFFISYFASMLTLAAGGLIAGRDHTTIWCMVGQAPSSYRARAVGSAVYWGFTVSTVHCEIRCSIQYRAVRFLPLTCTLSRRRESVSAFRATHLTTM